jgi:hypothetical protein
MSRQQYAFGFKDDADLRRVARHAIAPILA